MPSRVLVVGSGAVGLRTALELLRRQIPVVIHSPITPLDRKHGTSYGAGGLWMPFRANLEDSRMNRWALETLDELLSIHDQQQQQRQNNQKQSHTDSSVQSQQYSERLRYDELVEVVPAIQLFRDHVGPKLPDFSKNQYQPKLGQSTLSDNLPAWTHDARLQFQHLTVEMLCWQNVVNRLRIPSQSELQTAGYQYAWLFHTPIVNTPKMLQYLLTSVDQHPLAQVEIGNGLYYKSMQQMKDAAKSFQCDAVINCTGLGALDICPQEQQQDMSKSLVPGRGVLLHFDRNSCIRRPSILEAPPEHGGGTNIHDALIGVDSEPWGSYDIPCYMIPRGDTIIVGGSYILGDQETSLRRNEREQLLLNATRLGIDTSKSPIKEEWVGFRPCRHTVRCEYDEEYSDHDLVVVHNYGHGGSGWTINVGTARESVDILLSQTLTQ